MKKILIILFMSGIFLTATQAMQEQEEPIISEQLVIADANNTVQWADLPQEIKHLIFYYLADDEDSVLAFKSLKKLELVDHESQNLSRDETIRKLVFRKFARDNKKLNKAFVNALFCNDLASIEYFLEFIQSNTIDTRNDDGRTALMGAVRHKDVQLAKFLLSNGADVTLGDDFADTVLLHAIHSEDKPTIRLILSEAGLALGESARTIGNDPRANQLFSSVILGEIPRVKALLERPVNPHVRDDNSMTPLMFAAYRGRADMVELFIKRNVNINGQDRWGRTALHLAVRRGKKGVVNLLMYNNANVNLQTRVGSTPLMGACKAGYIDIARDLIFYGADVNLLAENQLTALMFAAQYGQKHIVDLLIENGAVDVTIEDMQSGYTPLMWACYRGKINLVNDLIQQGACINSQDKKGNTALMWGAYNGHADIVKLLLENGADETIINNAQETAFDIAQDQNHAETVNIFESYKIALSKLFDF